MRRPAEVKEKEDREEIMNQPLQTVDLTSKKHVPVIDVTKKDKLFQINVTIGKGKVHTNTNSHHISWIKIYFLPAGERFPYMIGKFDFTAHGILDKGVDSDAIYTHPEVVCFLRTGKPGKLHVTSYCNVHGSWTGTAELSD
jgi:superoxide reductase